MQSQTYFLEMEASKSWFMGFMKAVSEAVSSYTSLTYTYDLICCEMCTIQARYEKGSSKGTKLRSEALPMEKAKVWILLNSNNL